MTEPLPLTRLFRISEATGEGKTVAFTASEAERAALAAHFDLVAVQDFVAAVTVRPGKGGEVILSGAVDAEIVQNCVVTLEPLTQAVHEEIDLHLVPAGSAAAARAERQREEEADGPEPPEIYTGASIDIGAYAMEFFAVGIDPYPRAPGAELPQDLAVDDGDATASPFSALARLKRPPGGAG